MNISKQQAYLIASIKLELAKKDKYNAPSSYFDSVWFYPRTGRFLYADGFVLYEIVEPLIKNATLVFDGFKDHQGEKMLKYILR